MISILVTTKDPEVTFQKSFNALLESCIQLEKESNELELIIVSPNKYSFLEDYAENIIQITDKSQGKPEALNQGVQKASGEWIICTDGDVLLDKMALFNLYMYAKINKLSICGGKPVSIEDRSTMLGYWSNVLTEGNADKIRTLVEDRRKLGHHEFFPVSGYLFIIKKDIFPIIPRGVLSEDALISYEAFIHGYQVGYDNTAIVYISYPKTYRDYLIQKVRSTGGYVQKGVRGSRIRSFRYEALNGIFNTLKYPKNLKELIWSFLLILSRLHIWVLILIQIRILRKKDIWKVVQSSKDI